MVSSNKKIILIGESLGCYPTCWLAAHTPFQFEKIVLCVPFDQLSSVTPMGSCLLGNYNNLELIQKTTSPTLIIQASKDEIMPLTCGNNLFQKCSGRVILDKVDTYHNDYFNSKIQKLIHEFIRETFV